MCQLARLAQPAPPRTPPVRLTPRAGLQPPRIYQSRSTVDPRSPSFQRLRPPPILPRTSPKRSTRTSPPMLHCRPPASALALIVAETLSSHPATEVRFG